MIRPHVTLAAALAASLAALTPQPAEAWFSANRWGGSTAHSWGATTHDNRWGGSTTHVYGEGTSHTGAYGNTYYHPPGGYYGGYHPYYPAYHPPVVVNSYSPGCYGCGAAVGAVAGMAVGAAAASAASSSAAASSYSAGYAAGAATATAYAMGSSVTALPPGSVSVTRGSTTYYIHGNTWFLPTFGAGGVYYRVVPAP